MSYRKPLAVAIGGVLFAFGSLQLYAQAKYAGHPLESSALQKLRGAPAGGDIVDGGVSRTFGDFAYDSPGANGSDGPLTVGANNTMFKTNWYFRVGGATQENRFGVPDTATISGDTAVLTYSSLGGGAFSAELEVTVDEPSAGQGTQYSTMSVTNLGGSPITIDLFNYTDIDAGGSFGNDSATDASAGGNIIIEVVDGGSTIQIGGEAASAYQVNEWSTSTTSLPQTIEDTDPSVTNLDNSGLPFGPGDFTSTVQWSGLSVAPGATVSVRHGIAENTPLVFGTLADADLSLALAADPNPVDNGMMTTIEADVANAGPDAAPDVQAVVTLPPELAYQSSAPADWSCAESSGVVTCDLTTGDLGSGASAPTLEIEVLANTATPPFSVTVDGEVDGAVSDPDALNNLASVDIDIDGLPDCIFADGFEEGGDGSCTAPVDPDIVVVDDVNFVPPADFTGGSIQWLTSNTCICDDAPFNLNIWASGGNLAFFWPVNANGAEGGVSLDGGTTYAVLGSGDEIGPGSNFLISAAAAAAANWRQSANVDGYIGFRFLNTDTGQTNYGYARLMTTGATGHPATIVSYAYNSAGNPITIP